MNEKQKAEFLKMAQSKMSTSQSDSVDRFSALADIPVEITAVVGHKKMTIGQLTELNAGDVVSLNKMLNQTLDIYANNVLIAKGELVEVAEELSVVLTELVL